MASKENPSHGRSKKRGPERSAHRKAAEAAGMSRGQMHRAMLIASIPEEEFEAMVEGDTPPTLSGLVDAARRTPMGEAKRARRLTRCPHCGGDLTAEAKK